MKPNAFTYHNFYYEGDYTLQFLYGHDKQRRKTTFYDANGLAMEKYFVGLYEKEIDHQKGITRNINYITAGDGMTAIVLQEEQGYGGQGQGQGQEETVETNTYFTYKDHLGSIVALTDFDGDVIYEQAFDSWGRYRNPYDWSFNDIPESPTWLRGYTGHCLSRSIFSMFSYEIENSSKITIGEHLPHFDLINMNGRVYDPILGRMLSPDRFVPDPLSSQGYNRYSYVLNNPLRYTDPSGDIVIAPIIIGAAIGAYQGWQLGKAKGAEGWEMAGYIAGGTLIGGAAGLIGGAVATSGGFMASTSSIVFSSTINSMGMNIMSGGNTDLNISYGAGNYNITSGEFGYLGKKGNSAWENVGYGFGALANVGDLLVGTNPGEIQLNTEKDIVGHSAITDVGETNPKNSIISVGPDPGGKWIFNPLKFKKGTNKWKNYVDAGDGVWKVNVEGVNVSKIQNYGSNLSEVKYNLYFSSCVNHTARALTLAGAPSIGIHPALLHAQMYLRSIGFRPMMYSYHLY